MANTTGAGALICNDRQLLFGFGGFIGAARMSENPFTVSPPPQRQSANITTRNPTL